MEILLVAVGILIYKSHSFQVSRLGNSNKVLRVLDLMTTIVCVNSFDRNSKKKKVPFYILLYLNSTTYHVIGFSMYCDAENGSFTTSVVTESDGRFS